MKFFSNDAKETTEDQAHDNRDLAAPGSVEADPAAVPQQRAGSPWSDAPGTDADLARDDYSRDEIQPDDSFASEGRRNDDELRTDDQLRTDDELSTDDQLRTDDSEVRTDGDEPVRSADEDATATAHTEAVDLPLDDDDETRDRADAQGFGDRSDSGLGTVENRDDVDERDGFGDRPVDTDDGDRQVADGEVADAQTYGPDGTVTPATEQPDDSVSDEVDAQPDTSPVTSDVDEEVTDTSADFEPAAAATTTDPTPDSDTDTADADVVAVPVDTADKTPGSVEEPKIDRLFADGDSFAERFREIQLRFVDSPKDATAEAATLVGEAVDRLTSALKSQQEGLSSKSDDTEQLRVELRGYRDMLNRLTAL